MADRQYKTRCTGIEGEESSYTLAYGKGSKKLTGTVKLREDKLWYALHDDDVEPIASAKQKKLAIERWTAWAVETYSGSPASPSSGSETPSTAPAGPPTFKPSANTDELSEFERGFFGILATKHGDLTEQQRAQCRAIFRRIGWPNRRPEDITTGKESTDERISAKPDVASGERPATSAPKAGPPAYRPPPVEVEAPAGIDPQTEYGTVAEVSG